MSSASSLPYGHVETSEGEFMIRLDTSQVAPVVYWLDGRKKLAGKTGSYLFSFHVAQVYLVFIALQLFTVITVRFISLFTHQHLGVV